jgi:amidohydrolase
MRPYPAVLASLLGCASLAWGGFTASAAPVDYAGKFRSERASLEALYRHFHSHPELSWRESSTATRLAAEWKAAGCEITTGFATNGIVGRLQRGSGPVILLRTDLDALPVKEETGLEFASTVKVPDGKGGETFVMHACGHDLHMTALTGVARLLQSLPDWQGTVLFVGQPAEEVGSGARAMLRDGLYQKFGRPDFALSLHCHANLPAGSVGIVEGFVLANVDSIDIRLRGVGGHGAYPETTRDPIVLAAQSILALQTIRSREIAARDAVVVTVGSIHGGSKHNIIPDEVALQLTVRSYTDEVRDKTLASIRRIVRGQALAAGIPEDRLPEVRLGDNFTPALYNDPALAQRVRGVLGPILGPERVLTERPQMGGEDFSEFGRTAEKVPLFDLWIGVVEPGRYAQAKAAGQALPSLHSNQFAPDLGPALETAVTSLTACVLDLLRR